MFQLGHKEHGADCAPAGLLESFFHITEDSTPIIFHNCTYAYTAAAEWASRQTKQTLCPVLELCWIFFFFFF